MNDQAVDFEEFLKTLTDLVSRAHALHAIWKELSTLSEGEAAALNRYRGFFLPTKIELRDAMLLELAKVLDENEKTVSLINLVRLLRRNRDLIPEEAEDRLTPERLRQLAQRLNGESSFRANLKRFRDQRLAHYALQLEGDTSLRHPNEERMIEAVVEVFNEIQSSLARTYTSFQKLADDAQRHTRGVIQVMVDARNGSQSTGRGLRAS